jgi:hypothetical protein
LGKWIAMGWLAAGGVACQAQATVGPPEECRNVEVRNRHDVETCHAHCNNDGCREHCTEREHWAREHRCWVD